MALTPRLDLRQVQTLVMTPQLQQAIKLLQLSNLELADYLDEELEKNPLLQQEDQSSGAEDENQNPEIQEPDQDGSPDTEVGNTDFEDGFDTSDITDLIGTKTLSEEKENNLDAEYDDVWSQEGPTDVAVDLRGEDLDFRIMGASPSAQDEFPIDISPAANKTLREHLTAQASLDIAEAADRAIANALIDLLEDTGYLTTPISEIANILGCKISKIEQILQKFKLWIQQVSALGTYRNAFPFSLGIRTDLIQLCKHWSKTWSFWQIVSSKHF